MQRKTNTFLAVLGFVVVCILISCCLNYSTASAYSLTVTTSGSITTDITPASDDGVGTTIVTDEVRITSNCRSGYTFTIAGSSDNNLYLNGDDTNNTAGTYFTPVDGVSALSDTNNINRWGYSIAANTESGVFTPLADTSATIKTPSQTSSPDSDINTTLPIYYGTAVDSTIIPGAYTFSSGNSIIYTVTMEPTCLTYTVQYQDGGADNPNGMGTTNEDTGEKSVRQTNLSEGATITLLAPNYKKAGYGFLGWSTDSDAYTHFTDNDNTNDPIIYGPMETVTITANMIALATDRNQINMYPVWVPALKDGSNNTVYFQDWDNPNTTLPHDGCSTLTQTVFDNNQTNEKDKIKVTKNSVVALTDKRDNEVYTVAKLADGKCWMIENLRLDNQYTMGQNQNDPNVTNQYLSQGYGGTTGTHGNFVGLANSESTNFSNTTPNSVYQSSDYPPTDTYDPTNNMLEDIGTWDSPNYRFPRYNNDNSSNPLSNPSYVKNYSNPSNPSVSGAYAGSSVSSYANYYSFAAAMASTNRYAGDSTSENTGTSICPAGWHLPSSNGATKDFGMLSQGYGGTGNEQNSANNGAIMSRRFRSYPNNFLYSGAYSNSSASERGVNGRYWSRSAYGNDIRSYNLRINDNSINTSAYDNGKNSGFSIRCLITPSDVEITLDSNNGTGAISRTYGTPGSSVSLSQSSVAQLGYGFKNWNTAPDGSGTAYTTSYAIPADSTGITLYAQWYSQYTIVYVNNCLSWASGNASCTQSASNSKNIQRINLDSSGNGSGTLKTSNAWTTMSGWKISGWNTSPDGSGTEYRISTTYQVTNQSAGDGITLYAHWIPTYTIQYDGNGADNPNGMGTTNASGIKSVKQINVGEGDTILLFAPNFKRVGYGFAGWSTNPNATVNGNDKIYGPMETIIAPAYPNNDTNTITMYAIWVEAEKDNNGNPIYLQDFTAADCNNLTNTTFDSQTNVIAPGSVIALTDKRDNEVYAIAKLADDNCWMIENLRLNNQHTMGQNQNDNTVTNQSLAQGYGGTTGVLGNFVGLANPESNYFNDNTTSNSVYKSSANPPADTYNPSTGTLEDISTSNNPGFRFPRYNNNNTNNLIDSITYTQDYINSVSPSSSGTNYRESSNLYSYGNYYTWNAALANTNHYVGPTSTDNAGKNSENVGTSLCPTGWHLPSSSSPAKELGFLSQKYGGNGNNQSGIANSGDIMSNRFRTFPNNFLFSGRFLSSSANYRGTMGLYWTRSSWNSSNAYELRLNTSNLAPLEHDGKSNGFTIRCLINP